LQGEISPIGFMYSQRRPKIQRVKKNSGSELNSVDISIVAENATDRTYSSSFPTDSLGSACHHGSR